MKIGYLVSEYPAISHTFILREVKRLRECGLQVIVSSINSSRAIGEEEEKAHTFYVKRAGPLGAMGAFFLVLLRRPFSLFKGLFYALWCGGADMRLLNRYFFYFVEALLVGRWLKHQNAAHLHVHFANPAASVGMLVRKIFPVTLSITVHGPNIFDNVTEHRLAQKVAAADFLICISAFAKSQVMKVAPSEIWKKIYVIPLGVDPDAFAPAPFRKRPAPFEILNVGRLTSAKGQYLLLRALGKLAEEGRDFRLRIIGEGPEEKNLLEEAKECGIAERVRFEGAFGEGAVRQSYAEADLFVSSSVAEGLPVVLMEAMASSLPCVATQIAGVPELIEDGECGFLVPPTNIEALAVAIARLMEDPALRKRFAEKGREKVCRDYHLSKNVEKLAELYREECR